MTFGDWHVSACWCQQTFSAGWLTAANDWVWTNAWCVQQSVASDQPMNEYVDWLSVETTRVDGHSRKCQCSPTNLAAAAAASQLQLPLCIHATLYKYWLVPTSTLKNYAPKLCNVARGPKVRGLHCTTEGHNFSVLIEANSWYFFCYITENRKELQHSTLCLTGIFKLNSHT